jgi:hypothetical protein
VIRVATVVVLAWCATCGCDGPPSVPADAAAPDAPLIDVPPSRFGRCNATTLRAELVNGRLIDASAAGALIASPELALWPSDGGAPIALPGVPESAVLSGAAVYWHGNGDTLIEHTFAGSEREITIASGGLPSTIVRADGGGVYVISTRTPATIESVAPGGAAQLVTTATTSSPITDLAAGADVLVWQEGPNIRRRTPSTGVETTLLTDPSARLLGVHEDTFVVERDAFAFYRLSDGSLEHTLDWDEGPIVRVVLGPRALYIAMDRRERMIERQWCSLQASVTALAIDGTATPLVSEPELVVAAPDQTYVQTAAVHGQTCCSGHGMFSCSTQSMEPTAVWCFVP